MARNDLVSLEDYQDLLADLKERIFSARLKAATEVNRGLISLYWSIGSEILNRQREQGWGTRVVSRLADDLRQAFPEMTGLSARNLKYMRALAEAYSDCQIVQQLLHYLPWGHIMVLLDAIKRPTERDWYARQVVEHGWSRSVLVHQIESNLYARQSKALTNFAAALPAPQSDLAQEMIKDPYSFDFLSLGPDMRERDVHRGLLEHMTKLILELGKGFAFVGAEYRIQVSEQDYFIDLLFYHLRLRCFVVFEIKVVEFRPEFAGKMNFYLSAVDDNLRHPDDKPSIGIILCKKHDSVIVEYALRDMPKPIGVAEYRVTSDLPDRLKRDLPTADELARASSILQEQPPPPKPQRRRKQT